MKYQNYVQNLRRYITQEAKDIRRSGDEYRQKEEELHGNSFYDAIINISFVIREIPTIHYLANRILETAAMLEATPHFVESQDQKLTAFEIGSAWIRRKENKK